MTTQQASRGGAYSHLDALPYALAVVRERHVVHANPALLALMDCALEQAPDGLCEVLSPPGSSSGPGRHERRRQDEPVPDCYETVLHTPRGELRVEVSLSRYGTDLLVLVRDLTGRLAQRQILQRLATLGAALPGIHHEQEVLRQAFEGLAALGLTHGYLVPEGERVRVEHVFISESLRPPRWESDGREFTGTRTAWTPLLERAWREGASHGRALWEGDDPLRTVLRRIGPLSAVCARIDVPTDAPIAAPIAAPGGDPGPGRESAEGGAEPGGAREGGPRALLVIAAEWLGEEELPAVRLFAAQVSAALASARTISRLSRHNTALAARNRLAAVAATAREPQELFASGATELLTLLRCQSVIFLLHIEQTRELELVWHQGGPPPSGPPHPRYSQTSALAEEVMRQDAPQVRHIEDFSESWRPLLCQTGQSSLAMVPLRVGARTVGLLVCSFSQRRELSPLERETLQVMGVHFAAAIDSHRLLQEVRGRAEELSRLHQELQHTQRQFVERERLAALGELSAVLAHEVRNPLGAIFNALSALRRVPVLDDRAWHLMGILTEESDRLNRLVDDLLDFARPTHPHRQPVPLSHLLVDAVSAAAPGQCQVRVEWALEPDVPPVPVDERMMRQAFLNLALNAVQAMPQGGTLRVRARRHPEGTGATVEFTDTGPGIPPELHARLFEPFFTTKATGTGLGLVIVRRTLRAHGGHVTIESPPTGGTTFRLEIPIEPSSGTPRDD